MDRRQSHKTMFAGLLSVLCPWWVKEEKPPIENWRDIIIAAPPGSFWFRDIKVGRHTITVGYDGPVPIETWTCNENGLVVFEDKF